MQVSQQDTHLTHAIINAGEQLSFGVSEDPMFFKMLYSSLYSDPRRAAFREPLCNAWDANIDNDMEDTPLQITITDESVTYKDSGKGIPHSKIREVYLTLGKSTKVDSSAQTGGFGLGCKAPFAYADHFEVRSYCEGICTIYRMMKVDPSNGGKPGASVIAQFPTTETGLTVTIPFVIHGHNRDGTSRSNDKDVVVNQIMQDIAQGGILAEVNGVLVPTIPLKREPGSWVIMRDRDAGLYNQGTVFVRYGSVVYPVRSMEGLANLSTVSNAVYRAFAGSEAIIVFQAPADSIVIPPSRESISTHEVTIATLGKIFDDFINGTLSQGKRLMTSMYSEAIKAMKDLPKENVSWDKVLGMSLHQLCKGALGVTSDGALRPTAFIDSFDAFNRADLIYRGQIGKHVEQVREMRYTKLNKLVEAGMLSHSARKHIRYLLSRKEVRNNDHAFYYKQQYVADTALRPLAAIIVKEGGKLNNLYSMDYNTYHSRYCMGPWTNVTCHSLDDAAAYYRGNIILAYSKNDAWELRRNGSDHPLGHKRGGSSGVLVYLCPRTKGTAAKLREQLSKYKQITLIDLTERKDIEAAEAEELRRERAKALREAKKDGTAPVKPKPVKQPGFAALANARCSQRPDATLYFRTLKSTNPIRVLEPRFWVKLPEFARRGSDTYAFDLPDDPSEYTRLILGMFADQGIAVMNKDYEKYIAKNNVPEFREFLVAYLERALGSCKQLGRSRGLLIRNVLKHCGVKKNKDNAAAVRAYRDITSDPWLATHYNVLDTGVSSSVNRDVELLDRTIGSQLLAERPDLLERVVKVQRDIQNPIPSKEAKKLLNKLLKIKGLEFINVERACTVSSAIYETQLSERRVARKFLTNLIKK